jgi:hypothetical protein
MLFTCRKAVTSHNTCGDSKGGEGVEECWEQNGWTLSLEAWKQEKKNKVDISYGSRRRKQNRHCLWKQEKKTKWTFVWKQEKKTKWTLSLEAGKENKVDIVSGSRIRKQCGHFLWK